MHHIFFGGPIEQTNVRLLISKSSYFILFLPNLLFIRYIICVCVCVHACAMELPHSSEGTLVTADIYGNLECSRKAEGARFL